MFFRFDRLEMDRTITSTLTLALCYGGRRCSHGRCCGEGGASPLTCPIDLALRVWAAAPPSGLSAPSVSVSRKLLRLPRVPSAAIEFCAAYLAAFAAANSSSAWRSEGYVSITASTSRTPSDMISLNVTVRTVAMEGRHERNDCSPKASPLARVPTHL